MKSCSRQKYKPLNIMVSGIVGSHGNKVVHIKNKQLLYGFFGGPSYSEWYFCHVISGYFVSSHLTPVKPVSITGTIEACQRFKF